MSTIYSPDEPLVLAVRSVKGLNRILAKTNRVAFQNVTHEGNGKSLLKHRLKLKIDFSNYKISLLERTPIPGKRPPGGPFGSEIVIVLPDGSVEEIGKVYVNDVIGSGVASRHAEDRALQAENYEKLVKRLEVLKKQGIEATVWVASSGQSCPNCHTKQEVMARDLIRRGLIKPKQFVTLYGATYDDTFQIAQFYDAQYADAIILFSREPKHEGNLINHKQDNLSSIPPEVQEIFRNATVPTAVVVRDGKVHSIGREGRTEFDLYSTAEVSAVREACLKNRQMGQFASWEGDGELYTTSSQMGPLLFAEMSWTGIKVVRSVKMPQNLAGKQFETRETPDLSNTDFSNIIAGGYRHADAAIRVVRDGQFKNTAQPMWARVLAVNNDSLYNGPSVSEAVLAMRDTYTRYLFAADDICNHCPGMPHRDFQPLLSLQEFRR